MSDGSLDDALDRLAPGGGVVRVDRGGTSAEVDVIDVDRLGVKLKEVRLNRTVPVDISGEARSLPERLRSLPDRVEPVEVSPELGGARLRTRPEELRGEEYFEVDVEPKRTQIRRTRLAEDGTRTPTDFTLTREQLDRLIDETRGS
jgi:hypothetical protein